MDHPLVNDRFTPSSPGAVEQTQLQDGINLTHEGNSAFDTADFAEPPGNLRVGYVLPRVNMVIEDGAVFWPL